MSGTNNYEQIYQYLKTQQPDQFNLEARAKSGSIGVFNRRPDNNGNQDRLKIDQKSDYQPIMYEKSIDATMLGSHAGYENSILHA